MSSLSDFNEALNGLINAGKKEADDASRHKKFIARKNLTLPGIVNISGSVFSKVSGAASQAKPTPAALKSVSAGEIRGELNKADVDYAVLYDLLRGLTLHAEEKAKEYYIESEKATTNVMEYEERYAESLNKIDNLQKELNQQNSEMEVLEKQIGGEKEKFAAFEQKVKDCNKKIKSLNSDLDKKKWIPGYNIYCAVTIPKEIEGVKSDRKAYQYEKDSAIKVLDQLGGRLSGAREKSRYATEELNQTSGAVENILGERERNKLLSTKWSDRVLYCRILADKIDLYITLEKTADEFGQLFREFQFQW